MIKSVDGHNKALLREQAKGAKDARTKKAGDAGISRLFGGAMQSAARDAERAGRRDRDRGREASRRDDRSRRPDDDHGEGRRSKRRDEEEYDRRRDRSRDRHSRRRSRSRSRSTSRDRERPRDRSRDRYDRRERHRSPDRRRRDRSYSTDRNDKKKRGSSRERERRRDRERDGDRVRERSHDRYDGRDRSRDRGDRRDRERSPKPRSHTINDKHSSGRHRRPRPPSSSPPPPPPASPPGAPSVPISRMDKYFKQDYDPRLDVGPVPKEGIVADVGWDNMLAVLKERGQKVSPPRMLCVLADIQRRRHSPGLSSSPEPERKSRHDAESSRSGRIGPSMPGEDKESKSLLDMEYTPKGGMRAWDVGK